MHVGPQIEKKKRLNGMHSTIASVRSIGVTDAGKKKRMTGLQKNEALWGYLFIAPGTLLLLVFVVVPVLTAGAISLTRWTLLSPPEFVGLANYRRLLPVPLFHKVLLNTFYFTAVSIPLGIFCSLGMALALNQKIRGLSFFRTAYYLPVISASVAVSAVWMWLLDGNYGLINFALVRLGLPAVGWLNSTLWAMPAIILVTVWKNMGFNMIIYLAALQDVPQEMYEAARMDGAGRWKLFQHITLPMISPALFFTIITGVISSFQSFDLVYNMTDGGPARSTTLIGYYIWQQAFEFLRMGYGAAVAYVLFFLILVVTLLQWQARRRWVFGEEAE
jgi:multiple sugar transport system permease protein